MKKLSLLFIAPLFVCAAHSQVRTPTLYITGSVLSDEKMLVSVIGAKTIEGNVVTAEINGKKTQVTTNNKGHAILDFSAIADQVGSGVAVIKSFDKNGNLLSTTSTNVQKGSAGAPARPVIEQLPKNISNGEPIIIHGQHLGTDAQFNCGNQYQETLAASDNEMTVLTTAKPGEQQAYVITPNGVSESQKVNVYSVDFALPKSTITPRENVQAHVNYESIAVGTKLIFTNKSPETIKMTIPGAVNSANECIYTVAEQNGSLPVNITGILKGDFKIALDFNFSNEQANNNTGPAVYNDNSKVNDEDPCDKILVRIGRIKERLDELYSEFKKLFDKGEEKSKERRLEILRITAKHEQTIEKLYKLYDDCLDKEIF